MDFNKEYKQISVHKFSGHNKDYDFLKGKVVDKVAFNNYGDYDGQLFIITFTDKTFVAVGPDYNDSETRKDEPKIENQFIMAPQCFNSGDFRCHSWTNSEGKLCFDEFITILRDLGIWEFTNEDAKAIMDQKAKDEEEREYQQYLRLKAKFEPKENKQL
jgi:hypothetical protein